MSSGAGELLLRADQIGESFVEAYSRQIPLLTERVNSDELIGLKDVNDFALHVFWESEEFSVFRNVLGDSDADRTTVRRALEQHAFPSPESVLPEQYSALLIAAHVKEQLSRAYMLELLGQGETFGLKPWERDVLAKSCQVAGVYDTLGLKWRESVQHHPNNAVALEQNLKNPYTVIVGDAAAGYTQIALAEAFPEEIAAIVDNWRDLVRSLDQDDGDMERWNMRNFVSAYVDALESKDVEVLEALWAGVDQTWMSTTGRVQIVPGREEGYYDPNKLRVFPDMRVSVATDARLDQRAENIRQEMLVRLTRRYGDHLSFQETRKGLEKVWLRNVYDVVSAAAPDFRAGGQSLPNNDAIRETHGTKVFLNATEMQARWDVAMPLAQELFGRDFELFEQVDVEDDLITVWVAGHEFSEPLLDSTRVNAALGAKTMALLNEDAATDFISVLIPELEAEKVLSRGAALRHAVACLGFYLRYMGIARGAGQLGPYYEGMTLLGIKRMLESGFIYQDAEGWRINPEKLDHFYAYIERDQSTQVKIADDADPIAAVRYLIPVAAFEDTPQVADLINRVGVAMKIRS